jgi:hypothetical protein
VSAPGSLEKTRPKQIHGGPANPILQRRNSAARDSLSAIFLSEVEVIDQTSAGCCEFVLLTIAMEGEQRAHHGLKVGNRHCASLR